jgi:hypothetical protein
MNLKNCHNYGDFRKLAKKKLPSPIFHYIDGAADDEITYARNTSAFDDVDLVPNVLRGVENVDLSTTIFGKNWIYHFIYHLQHYKDFFIMMEKEQLEGQLKNLIQCLVFQLWLQSV